MYDHLRNNLSVGFIVAITVATFLPVLLNIIGMDFGATKFPLDFAAVGDMSKLQLINAQFKALGGGFMHALLDWSGVIISSVGVIAGYILYKNTGRVSVMVLTIALAIAGFIDAYHVLIASRLVDIASPLSTGIPFSWAACRLFNAVILMVGAIYFLVKDEDKIENPNTVIFGFLIISVLASVILMFYIKVADLPRTSFPNSAIVRPYDLGALVFYLAAIIIVYPKLFMKYKTPFVASLLVSMGAHVMAQLYMAFFSSALFDNAFNVGHFLKIIAYAAPFIGVLEEIRFVWVQQKQAETQLKEASDQIKNTMEQEKQAKEQAEQASEELRQSSIEIREAMTKAQEAEQALRESEKERKLELNKLAETFETEISQHVYHLCQESMKMMESVNVTSTSAIACSEQSQDIARQSEEAAMNVQTVAAASEEMTASIHAISNQTEQSTSVCNNATGQANQATSRVTELTDAARGISDVANLIADIADQTNLLALNATIEAARAGEAGKGFAVVASEVKNLATQTTKATEDITAKINEIQRATQDTSKDIGAISGVITQINTNTSEVQNAITEQQMATSEIAQNIQKASSRTDQISDTVKLLSESSKSAANASSEAVTISSEVTAKVDALDDMVKQFVAKIRVN